MVDGHDPHADNVGQADQGQGHGVWRRRRESADAGAAADRYVAQPLSADALLTGHENVELFARPFDVPRRERRERVDAAL